jgi:hypothetical protein
MHILESKVPNCEKNRTVSVVTAFIPISWHFFRAASIDFDLIFTHRAKNVKNALLTFAFFIY